LLSQGKCHCLHFAHLQQTRDWWTAGIIQLFVSLDKTTQAEMSNLGEWECFLLTKQELFEGSPNTPRIGRPA
jgi:hypothetical protein